MARGGDLTVAMRVQADMAAGVKQLKTLEDGLDGVSGAAAGVSTSAARAGSVLANAFSSLGIRSVDEIKYEIKSLEQAYNSLRTSGVASTEDLARAQLALQQRTAALNAEMGRTPQHLKAGSAAMATGTQQLNRYGVSAGQTAMAMRQLPMQVTDIFTSLAGGQNPLLVMVQQGGQLKDSFGGIVPAARALVGAINPMVLAVGAVALVAGSSAIGMYQASEAANDLSRAIELTGNRSGATADMIREVSLAAATASRQSIGTSQEIATSLVATGEYGSKMVSRLTGLIADFAKKTEQDTGKVTTALDKVFRDPAKGAAELNKVMNFLSFEQLKYIENLQKQGRVEEAQLALADALATKLSTMQVHLNSLTGWWDKLAVSAKNAWNEMFSERTDGESLVNLQRQLKFAQESLEQAEPGTPMAKGAASRVALIQAEIKALSQKNAAEKTKSAQDEKSAAQNQAHIAAMTAIDKLEESVKTKTQQRADALKVLSAQLKAGTISQDEYQRGLAAINKKYEDKTVATAAAKIDNAYAQQQLSLTKEIAASKRNLEAAAAGVTVEEGRARDNLESWLELNRTALKLQPQQVENLRQMADEADRLAKAAADANYLQSLKKKANSVGMTEEKTLANEIDSKNLDPQAKAEAQAAASDYIAKKDAETLKQINRQFLEASGNTVAAQAAAVEAQYGELINRMTTRGDEAGLKIVKGLININATKAQLDALQAEIDKVFARQSAAENSLQTQVATGSLSQSEAQQKLLDLHKATALEVEAMIPKMQALAEASGDPKAVANVSALSRQVAELKNEASQLEIAFKGAFTSNMGQALEDLASGTKSLGESAKGFINGLSKSMAQFASQKLAESMYEGLASMVKGASSPSSSGGKTASGSSAQSGSIFSSLGSLFQSTQTSTPKTTGASATAGAGTGESKETAAANKQTEAQTAAASSAGSLASSLARASGASEETSSVFGMIVSAAEMLITAIFASTAAEQAAAASEASTSVVKAMAATGGYISGPGTGTSDSIPALLSNGEFVARAAVVQQPGAREFLHDFNRHGMRALQVQRFADGGLVSASPMQSPTRPAYQLAQASQIQTGPGNVTVQQRLLPVLDPDLISESMKGPKGEELVLFHITRNPAKFRQAMGR